MRRFLVLPLCLLAGAAPLSWAARPFVTDDARLTTAQSCQLESWVRSYRHSTEVWALPACNPTGDLEFTFGGGRARDDGAPVASSDGLFQLKTLFKPLEANGWGWGLAAGAIRHPSIHPGPNQFGNSYFYLPFSVSLDDDRVVLHANAGWLRERKSRQGSMTWGLGGEYQASPRWLAIAEAFGDHRSQPYWQLGARYAIVPNRVQVDATVGQPFGGNAIGRWISFGLRLTPESLF